VLRVLEELDLGDGSVSGDIDEDELVIPLLISRMFTV